MTTIILTIIGILLAAAAALMVIFYGGDAFNGGSIGAQANTYQNAGTNVVSAIQLAKADGATYTDLASLHGGTPETDYLKEVPALNEAAASSVKLSASGSSQFVAGVGGVNADKVCARINKNLKLATAPTAIVTTVKMGCVESGASKNTFFANA